MSVGPAAPAPLLPHELGRWVDLPRFADSRGVLSPFDFEKLPFEPRRIFYVGNVPPGTARGGHAHLLAEQLLVCLSGRIEVELHGNGASCVVACEAGGPALYLCSRVWSRQTYLAAGSLLLVLSSHPYDPASYLPEVP